MKKALIISISSDIGHALALRWHAQGIEVAGTFRKASKQVVELKNYGIKMVSCDMSKPASVRRSSEKLRRLFKWDYLVLCPGALEPVGPFEKTNFDAWRQSIEINFTSQLQCVHELLPSRHRSGKPSVLFFAGGGTNNATVNYSAYTISKIALIKMCELLDAEIPDTNFIIVGPGWVKTKIHEATLKAGKKAGTNYQKTIEQLKNNACTPMDKVLDCCDWLLNAERKIVSGRNFSTAFDAWGTESLKKKLLKDPDMYKLRRKGNERN